MQPTGETQLSFYEAPTGQPEALRAWFYPGDNFGQEFTYPKDRAILISQNANTKVPTTPADWNAGDSEQAAVNESAMTPDNRSTMDPNFRVSGPQISDEDMTGENGAGVRQSEAAQQEEPMNDDASEAAADQDDADAQDSQATPAPGTMQEPATRTDRDAPRMPQTAGEGALIGLLGMLMAGGALAARRLRVK
jgi:hypothetical protein